MKRSERQSTRTETTSNTVTPPPKCKPRDGDIILSLKNHEYKEIMFAKFRMMGKRAAVDDKAKLDMETYGLFSLFKQDMGKDGRFLRSDRLGDMWAVEDNEALQSKRFVSLSLQLCLLHNSLNIPLLYYDLPEIKMDIKRRNESIKYWHIE